MGMRQLMFRGIAGKFRNPTGPGGRLAGWVMGRRASNVERNRWAVGCLDLEPSDRVLELGCGPGVALAALAERVAAGLAVGVDQSAVMVRQAQRRNAHAVRAGRVQVLHVPVETLPGAIGATPFDEPFDAALAVNTVGFWPDPPARLTEIRKLIRAGGRIVLVAQPRCPGADAATTRAAAAELGGWLEHAGFADIRFETLALDPPVCGATATNPG